MDTTMKAEIAKEQEWLGRLVGEWTYEFDAAMEPGAPPTRVTGREVVRSLAGLWVLSEGVGEFPGGSTGTTMLTLGYDSVRKRFAGSFVSTMMSYFWIYDGALDPARDAVILNTEGPSYTTEGEIGKYEDVIRFEGNDQRVLTSTFLGESGQRHEVVSMRYSRVR